MVVVPTKGANKEIGDGVGIEGVTITSPEGRETGVPAIGNPGRGPDDDIVI